ncbi:putative DNA methylase [Bacillus sp. TS-2]|nr:putative DNA methylase [Bacillus sp. TS-2]
MKDKQLEDLYAFIDNSAHMLSEQEDILYLDALAEVGDRLFTSKMVEIHDSFQKKKLEKLYQSITFEDYEQEIIRKALQLAVLKGMKGATQPHHSLTPDAVSLFISYLVNKVLNQPKPYILADLAVGSGNLLTAILNQSNKEIKALGFEVDETLLHLAYVNANLQKHEVELFHQDSIQKLPNLEADLVVTDLPIGYYPNDVVAHDYEVKALEGHSYIHHLMIEQALKQTKSGGYLFLLIPNFLFQTDQSETLHQFLKKESVILGLLQLPSSMFKNDNQAKSILMLQKNGEGVKQIQQALLAELPSFSKKSALADMVNQIDRWFQSELELS